MLSAAAHSSLILENTNPNRNNGSDTFAFQTLSKRWIRNSFLRHEGYKNKFTATCSRTIEVNRTGKNIAILEEIQAFKLLKFDIRIHLNPK